jgi:activator of 2-hydroxyglutaryl-CoA dehydratase
MAVAGIDVGSQSTKVVILERERILADNLEKDDLSIFGELR